MRQVRIPGVDQDIATMRVGVSDQLEREPAARSENQPHNNNDKVSRHSCLAQVHWFSTLTLVSLETQDECFLGIVDTGLGLGALDTWTVHH